jgi:hypothetical protein
VVWIDAVHGERLTPGVKTKTHVYVAVTSRNVHFVDTQGVNPVVRTVPLKEIECVEAQGHVAEFFTPAFPDANRNGERFTLTRKVEFRSAMGMDGDGEEEGEYGDEQRRRHGHETLGQRERREARRSLRDAGQYAEDMANRRANAAAAVSAGKSMMGRMISKMKALSSYASSSSSSHSSSVNKRSAAAADLVSPPPPTPPPPRRGDAARFRRGGWGPGPVTEGWSGASEAGPVTEAVMGATPLHHGTRGSAADAAPPPEQYRAALAAAVARRSPPLALGPVKAATAAAMNAAPGAGAGAGGGGNWNNNYNNYNNNNYDNYDNSDKSLSMRVPNNNDAAATGGGGSHFDVSAAMDSARMNSARSAGGLAAAGGSASGASPREAEAHYLYERIAVVTFEAGSQVVFQLQCAVVRLHARRAVRAAAAACSNPNTPRHSPGHVSSLASYIPRELLRGRSVAAAVSAASASAAASSSAASAAASASASASAAAATPNDVTSVSALAVAAGLVDNPRATSRHRDGRCTYDAALALPPPPPPSSSRRGRTT